MRYNLKRFAYFFDVCYYFKKEGIERVKAKTNVKPNNIDAASQLFGCLVVVGTALFSVSALSCAFLYSCSQNKPQVIKKAGVSVPKKQSQKER